MALSQVGLLFVAASSMRDDLGHDPAVQSTRGGNPRHHRVPTEECRLLHGNRETIEIEAEALANFLGIESEVALQVVDYLTVFAARVLVDVAR